MQYIIMKGDKSMAIKTYNYNDKTQISKHFNVQEFRCKCGKVHDIIISDELIAKLEQLYSTLNASRAIITSGYRCSTHDRSVGGNGYGQHTKGTACDVIFYDKNNKPISSKIVSCKAQDLGFKGIANITSEYIYTHLDVRSNGVYKGNEIYGTNNVTSDFYAYYGIAKPTTQVDVFYRAYANGKWLGEIKNYNNSNINGYSGIENKPVSGVAVKTTKGTIKYRVHIKGGNWLSWISAYNVNDWNAGCAGIKNRDIDGIQIDFNGIDGYEAKYRASVIGDNNYLPWVVGTADYAGIFGRSIDKIQVEIIKK